MQVLKDKVAVITGGTRGFGLALAKAYSQAGAAVVVASRSAHSVQQAVAELNSESASAAGIPCDVSEFSQVEALAEYTLSTFGRFDIWVNNAGFSAPYGPTVHIPSEQFIQVTQVNVLGTYYGSTVALRYFLARDCGKLINILGHGERGPVPFQSAYGSSKAWIRNFTQALAQEYKNSGVGIFAYNPGLMLTDMVQDVAVIAGYEEKLINFPTVLRLLAQSPAVSAKKAVWLASPASDGRSGLILRASSPGGMLLKAALAGLQQVFGRPAKPISVKITPVQPVIPIKK